MRKLRSILLALTLSTAFFALAACENTPKDEDNTEPGQATVRDTASASGDMMEENMNDADYNSAINWFEIPSKDFDRAVKFYNTVLGAQMPIDSSMEGITMAYLPMGKKGIGGAIVYHKEMKPAAGGTMVYLNGGEDLSPMLGRVEAAGGKIIVPKTKISDEIGYFATFEDTEGNHVSLHSIK